MLLEGSQASSGCLLHRNGMMMKTVVENC